MGMTALSDVSTRRASGSLTEQKTGKIYLFIMINIVLASCTYIVPMATLSVPGRYVAMMFMPCTSVGPQLLLYKTINHHMPRPLAKRAATIALMNSIGGTSNIWASYLWFAGPRYFCGVWNLCVHCGWWWR